MTISVSKNTFTTGLYVNKDIVSAKGKRIGSTCVYFSDKLDKHEWRLQSLEVEAKLYAKTRNQEDLIKAITIHRGEFLLEKEYFTQEELESIYISMRDYIVEQLDERLAYVDSLHARGWVDQERETVKLKEAALREFVRGIVHLHKNLEGQK